MKPKTILRNLAVAAMLLMPAAGLVSCQEDAPELMHKTAELAHKWMWTTTEGDAADVFEVSIEADSDTEITVVNFHNADGERMVMKVTGTEVSFGGDLLEGAMKVENGKGIITNSWLKLSIEYDIIAEGETDHIKAELTEDKVMAKKAKSSVAK